MELCDKYIHESIEFDPTMNDYLKLEKYSHLRSKYPNFMSKEYDEKEKKMNRKYLNLVKKKKKKTFYDELFYEDLKEYFRTLYFKDKYFPFSYLSNFLTDTLEEISSVDTDYDFSDEKSYEDYISRLNKTKVIYNSMIHNLKEGIQKDMTISKRIVNGTIEQLKDAVEEKTMKNKFKHYRKIPTKVENKFLEAIQGNIITHIKKFIRFLTDEYLDHCRDSIGLSGLKNGKRLYRDIVKSYSFKDYTPEYLHNLGIKEMNHNLKDLAKLKKKMKIKGDYTKFINHMTNVPSSKIKEKKEVLQTLKDLQTRLIKEVFDKNFNEKLKKKDLYNIRCVSRENKHMSAYYLLPDFNNQRVGTFYINALDPSLINKYELPVLTLHEGIPGHHYQTNFHMKESKPIYYRLSDYTSYIEGWGLYCEGLLEPKNNYEHFWQIIYNFHRSIRLVIDTGIHAFDWSYEKCFQFMKQYLPHSDEEIKNEIYRYICDPGQALSYKIGELFLLKLREKYFKKYKDDYKGFHSLVFKIGPLPLQLFEKKFNEYLK